MNLPIFNADELVIIGKALTCYADSIKRQQVKHELGTDLNSAYAAKYRSVFQVIAKVAGGK